MTELPVESGWTERNFARMLTSVVALAATVRLVYVLRDHRLIIGGDGFDYFLSGRRIADGLGYTSSLGDIGKPIAHHPPGWVTVLGVVNWLGATSSRDDQYVGIAIGLGVVVLAGFIGRRYFSPRVGVIAALIAAVYPGFWVLEGNILSEPLDLLVLGLFTLAIAGLHARPTMRRALAVGTLAGLVALVRSEQIALLVIVVAPVLIGARALAPRRRIALLLAAGGMCALVITPWTAYNATRFKDPVLLSTNDGNLLLLGNCPETTYQGPKLGYYDSTCQLRNGLSHRTFDRSQTDALNRRDAIRNVASHLDRMPIVVPARFGRLLALFHPSQTVRWVAAWMTTRPWLVWSWVLSYLCLIPFAVVGGIAGRRERRFLLPLVGPIIIVIVSVATAYGEPRYHTPSDLGVVVLAAAGIDWLLRRRTPRTAGRPTPVSGTRRDDSARAESAHDVRVADPRP